MTDDPFLDFFRSLPDPQQSRIKADAVAMCEHYFTRHGNPEAVRSCVRGSLIATVEPIREQEGSESEEGLARFVSAAFWVMLAQRFGVIAAAPDPEIRAWLDEFSDIQRVPVCSTPPKRDAETECSLSGDSFREFFGGLHPLRRGIIEGFGFAAAEAALFGGPAPESEQALWRRASDAARAASDAVLHAAPVVRDHLRESVDSQEGFAAFCAATVLNVIHHAGLEAAIRKDPDRWLEIVDAHESLDPAAVSPQIRPWIHYFDAGRIHWDAVGGTNANKAPDDVKERVKPRALAFRKAVEAEQKKGHSGRLPPPPVFSGSPREQTNRPEVRDRQLADLFRRLVSGDDRSRAEKFQKTVNDAYCAMRYRAGEMDDLEYRRRKRSDTTLRGADALDEDIRGPGDPQRQAIESERLALLCTQAENVTPHGAHIVRRLIEALEAAPDPEKPVRARAEIARELGIHRSTVSRKIDEIADSLGLPSPSVKKSEKI